jgi:rfaE bifunctional protein kinase chain/domain
MKPAEWVQRFAKARVVVLGDLVADEYVYGETERVSREAPVLIVRYESSETKLGGAANVAANVASLSGKVRPVGILGRDVAGRAMVEAFKAAKAETSSLLLLNNRCTETKTRILAGGRSTTRQQMLRLDRAAERPLTPTEQKRLRNAVREAARNAQALVVSDYGSGLFDDGLIQELRELSRRIPVCVDSRYNVRAFRGMTVVKPNEPELEAAVGHRLRSAADVETAGRKLLSELDVQALLVTRGRHGVSLFLPKRPTIQIPVWGPAEAVDVTGAGDTVLATLSLALAAGASFEEAAELANVAGGIVVQKPGTATCSREELLDALAQSTTEMRKDVRRKRAAKRVSSVRAERK